MSQADEALFGRDLFGDIAAPTLDSVLRTKFIFPPFTILDARSGDWQERKRQWLSLGIKSEIGRGANLLNFSDTILAAQAGQLKSAIPGGETGKNSGWMFKTEDGYKGGRALNDHEWLRKKKAAGEIECGITDGATEQSSGTSIFDPVLCELAYAWFCPDDSAQVVDPFAGGSVRGLIAAAFGLEYWGSELREEQVEANRAQTIQSGKPITPRWVCGDSRLTLANAPFADFLFSCPPYGSLERYSDDPRDLSAMSWPGFCEAYREIIALACSRLKHNRFAVFVVGDFRGSDGFYCHLVQETVSAFEAAGAKLYNHAILVNAVGSAALRATRIFGSGRKMVKAHQNFLVFVKGDPFKAAKLCKNASEL